VDSVQPNEQGQSPSITIQRDTYPEIRLLKRAAPAGTADWRLYVSGTKTDPEPSLSIRLQDSDMVWRFYPNGRMTLAGDPVADLDAVTKRHLEEQLGGNTDNQGTLTYQGNWREYSTAASASRVTRSAGMVFVEAYLSVGLSTSIAAATWYPIANIPAGYRPIYDYVRGPTTVYSGSNGVPARGYYPGDIMISSTGLIQMSMGTAITFGNGSGTVPINIAYRQGN
jgi:hypothetical protein